MQPTTTGPRSGGSRFFASPPRTCRISHSRQTSRPAKRIAGRKTAPGIFLRTTPKTHPANLPQVTETHQENSVTYYGIVLGCVVETQGETTTQRGEWVPDYSYESLREYEKNNTLAAMNAVRNNTLNNAGPNSLGGRGLENGNAGSDPVVKREVLPESGFEYVIYASGEKVWINGEDRIAGTEDFQRSAAYYYAGNPDNIDSASEPDALVERMGRVTRDTALIVTHGCKFNININGAAVNDEQWAKLEGHFKKIYLAGCKSGFDPVVIQNIANLTKAEIHAPINDVSYSKKGYIFDRKDRTVEMRIAYPKK